MRAAVLPFPSPSVTPRETMPAPEVIAVRYTEEEAGYVSFRPVVRQSFRLNDLLGMVLGITGKNSARIRQILRSGSVSFRAHRYWWDGFQVEEQELAALLEKFPDADPSRAFRAEACTAALVEAGGSDSLGPHSVVEFDRDSASRKGLFRRRSFWDALLAAAASGSPAYDGYSYQRRADLYRLELRGELPAVLAAAAKSLAPRDLRRSLRARRASHIVLVCPREVLTSMTTGLKSLSGWNTSPWPRRERCYMIFPVAAMSIWYPGRTAAANPRSSRHSPVSATRSACRGCACAYSGASAGNSSSCASGWAWLTPICPASGHYIRWGATR
jgi:hypothetical protein